MRLIAAGYKLVDVVARDAAQLIPVSPTWTRQGYMLAGIVPQSNPHNTAYFEDLLPDWSFLVQDRIGNESPVLQLGDGFHPQGGTLTGWPQLAAAFGTSKSAFYELAKELGLPRNQQGEYSAPVIQVALLYYQRNMLDLARRCRPETWRSSQLES